MFSVARRVSGIKRRLGGYMDWFYEIVQNDINMLDKLQDGK